MLTYLRAIVIGLLQGVTELFPVSSLGHSVLVPAFIGGSWQHLVTESSTARIVRFASAFSCGDCGADRGRPDCGDREQRPSEC
jgi:undecaprenyl pyrophosphate phosphatase UppP